MDSAAIKQFGMDGLLVCANIRASALSDLSVCAPGLGREGDLVVGTVIPASGQTVTILDHHHGLHETDQPQLVAAVLGSRDSSTHVCGMIPAAGIEIQDGTPLHWVGGPSGIVAMLVSDNEADSTLCPERSAGFRCLGLLQDEHGSILNVEDFAVHSSTESLDVPLLLVAASSSEAGKTVLCGKLVKLLTERGLRVGAIKATGTGGGLDGVHYREQGAVSVLDQVDAGLVTTHGSPELFKQRIPRIFHHLSEQGVDLIVTELGGDLVSANNPAFFEIEECMQATSLMLVIANDALAAHGIQALCANRLGFAADRIRYLTSPFRNHQGMSRRFRQVGIEQSFDPNDEQDLNALVSDVLSRTGLGSTR